MVSAKELLAVTKDPSEYHNTTKISWNGQQYPIFQKHSINVMADQILNSLDSYKFQQLLVCGKSGTGKTKFVETLIHKMSCTRDKSFHVEWHHRQEVLELPKIIDNLPKGLDAIYISHEHEDHFQAESLCEYNKNTQIYICNFPTDRFKNAIKDLGFTNISVLDSWKPEKINEDVEITSIKNPDLMFEDSVLLIKSKEGTVFCQTDCKMDYESLRKVKEAKPDIGFFMYSPANWYPIAYNYPEDKKMKLHSKEREIKLTDSLIM